MGRGLINEVIITCRRSITYILQTTEHLHTPDLRISKDNEDHADTALWDGNFDKHKKSMVPGVIALQSKGILFLLRLPADFGH